jgi:hypothetical protein
LSDPQDLGSELSVPSGASHIQLGGSSQRLRNLPATGSEFCFHSDPHVMGLTLATEGGSTIQWLSQPELPA